MGGGGAGGKRANCWDRRGSGRAPSLRTPSLPGAAAGGAGDEDDEFIILRRNLNDGSFPRLPIDLFECTECTECTESAGDCERSGRTSGVGGKGRIGGLVVGGGTIPWCNDAVPVDGEVITACRGLVPLPKLDILNRETSSGLGGRAP